MADPTASI